MEKKEKKIYFLYSVLLNIYTFSKIISSSYIDKMFFISVGNISDIINYICIVGLGSLFLCQNKIPKKKFLIIIIITIFLGIISIKFIDKTLILTYFFIISFPQKISIKKVAKSLFFCFAILITLIISASCLEIIKDYTFFQHNTMRHSFGFSSANSLANAVCICLLLYSYFKYDKWTIINNFIYLLCIVTIYYFTRSRLAFLIAVLNLVLINTFKTIKNKDIKEKIQKIVFFLSTYLIPFLSIFSIAITIYFSNNSNSKLFATINELFTGRLKWMIQYYKDYGIHLVGQQIETVSLKKSIELGLSWKNIDNAYLLFSIKYGIIFLIGFNYMYIKVGKMIKNNNNFNKAFLIIAFGLMGLTENFLIIIGYNFTLFFIAEMINGHFHKIIEEEKFEK